MANRRLLLQRLRRAAVSLPRLFSAPTFARPPNISSDIVINIGYRRPSYGFPNRLDSFQLVSCRGIHASQQHGTIEQHVMGAQKTTENLVAVGDNGKTKPKRKKLKGKRAVVRWLKFFRWKKKKEYERMTAEEKILYKLRKARKKEERLVEALKKIEPSDTTETTHDPEVLTPEEHFYFLKMGHKCKNYVPVGRRGIFQGVILNMHLHWKKHQTLKVVVKTFTPEEVREIAKELARLSGGIVLEIHEDNTIIMYRGKNYSQPPTEIMSPKVTLSRKKALDKSKYRDALHAVHRFIPRLQQDLEDLQAQMKRDGENKNVTATIEEAFDTNEKRTTNSAQHLGNFDCFERTDTGSDELEDNDSLTDSGTLSESENLSDIFETDSDRDIDEREDQPLYLDEVEKFPSVDEGEPENFEEHLRQIAAASKRENSLENELNLADLDEVDKIFLRASSLLKKKRR